MKDYTDLKLSELTVMLKDRGLLTSGEKDTLISRLEEYDHMNDLSPSPQLHPPVPPKTQPHQPAPSLAINLLPSANDLVNDEVDYANWEEAYGDDPSPETVKDNKTTTASSSSSGTLASDAVINSDSNEPKSNVNTATPAGENTTSHKNISQSSSSSNCTYTPVEVTTKSGFKYKSLAATFYGDSSKVAIETSPNTSLPKPILSTPPKDSSKAVSKPPSDPPLSVLPKTSIATAITTNATATISSNSPEGHVHRKSHLDTIKTTKSGFKFNSIASLFPTDSTTGHLKLSTTSLTNEPIAPTKPLPIENVVVDASSTYSSNSKLDDKDEQASKLVLRAKRFGIVPKDEVTSATKLRREARFGPSEVVDDLEAMNKDRMKMNKTELVKERDGERENVRQRVSGGNSGGKRRRQGDDNDRYYGREHGSKRQQNYRLPSNNYHRHRRYI